MNHVIVLTADELNIVGSALGEMPYKIVAPIFDKIRSQTIAQTNHPESVEVTPNDSALQSISKTDEA